MSDSPTPRTDKVIVRRSSMSDDYFRIVRHAEQLERELAAKDAELSEQCRLNAMGQEREAKLMAELADRASIRCANCHANPDLECEPLKTCRAELAASKKAGELLAGANCAAVEELEKLRETVSELTHNQRIQDSSTAAVMERSEKAEAELSTSRQWAEVEIADLRDDVKRHMQIATDAQTELAEARRKWDIAAGLYERTVDSTLERAEQAEKELAEAKREYYAVRNMLILCGEEECRDIQGYPQKLRALIDGLIVQRRRAAANEKNAQRYLWLRDISEPHINKFYLSVVESFHDVKFSKEQVDAAIDSALTAMQGGRDA